MNGQRVVTMRNGMLRRRSARREFQLTVPSMLLNAGQKVALVGRSGSGKSTVLDLLGLAVAPDHVDRFEIAVPGRESLSNQAADSIVDVARLRAPRQSTQLDTVRATSIGYILQTGGLLAFASVLENILLPIRATRPIVSEDRAWVQGLIDKLGIAHLVDAKPPHLSVGERQRVAIARAVSHRPSLLIADEPTAALDPDTAYRALGLLIEMTLETNSALIIASHDRQLIEEFNLDQATHRLEVSSGDSRRISASFSYDGSSVAPSADVGTGAARKAALMDSR